MNAHKLDLTSYKKLCNPTNKYNRKLNLIGIESIKNDKEIIDDISF